MISIREAIIDDLVALRNLAIEIYDDTFRESNSPENMQAFFDECYNSEVFLKEFKEPNTKLYLACNEEQLAGFMRLRVNPEVDKYLGSNHLELHRLYIHKDYQGLKLGQRFMQMALDFAKEQGFDWMWLGVWEKNFKAQHFYTQWGFERFSEHMFPMGDDPQVDWLLKKRVSGL